MPDVVRKKSPRAPSMGLDEALERTGKAYDKERLHPAPTDVVAQNIGYRGANNGTATAALASLRYFGLVERPREGVLAVCKDYENYRFAPSNAVKRALLIKFLRTPPLFAELLDLYEGGFPSDATLKYELMQRGFLPATASTLVSVLKRSVELAQEPQDDSAMAEGHSVPSAEPDTDPAPIRTNLALSTAAAYSSPSPTIAAPAQEPVDNDITHDRIPVRLTAQRRAWLLVPVPLYEADKTRIKAQIDLLLTEDGED